MIERRVLVPIILVPLIGYAGEALAQVIDPGDGLISQISQALASPQGISWPLAVVVAALLVAREARRAVTELGRTLHDWRPPTITVRLDTQRPPDDDERATCSRSR